VDLSAFAQEVGTAGPVAIAGQGTRGGAVHGGRVVRAPAGIVELQPDEMTVRCGAGTPLDELAGALGEVGQTVALPPGGTVGGALAVGRSVLTRLGHGAVRDTLLQVRAVTAEGTVVKAGGPTVKNVSGFDLCRLFVGSWGTLAFAGEVILRTRPRAARTAWFAGSADPFLLVRRLYRPAAVLWDGATTWVCLEGHPADVDEQAALTGLAAVDGPPPVPGGGRESVPPAALRELVRAEAGSFVAEVGVGIIHRREAAGPPCLTAEVAALHRRLKDAFDPGGRLNPGVSPGQIPTGGEPLPSAP
jgi:glycolate oxidase FAD binding subunit